MVNEVRPNVEEQIPLRAEPEAVEIPFTRELPAKQGYGEGDQNSFYSERQGFLWASSGDERGRDGYESAVDGLELAVDIMDRTLAQQELAASSARVAVEDRRQNIQLAAQSDDSVTSSALLMESIRATEEIDAAAQADPKSAASQAVVHVLNPSLEAGAKRAIAFRDRQLGTVSGRISDRRLATIGTSNWIADGAALLATPGRILFGQTKFPDAYFAKINEWARLTTAEQAAQWETLEQDLWDSAGDNAIVYSSMVMPFINPDDELWAKIDAGLDVADTLSVVFAVARLAGAPSKLRGLMKMRSLALSAGNKKVAAADTVRGVKKGEQVAVIEGHPVGVPDSSTTVPEVTAGLEVPTTSHLVNDLVDRGIVPDAPTDIPIEHIPMLNDSEKASAIERARMQIGTGGRVLRAEESSAGFDLVIEAPSVERVSVPDARKLLVTIEEELAAARTGLRDLVENTGVGEATGEIAALNNQIDALKARRTVIKKGVADAKSLEGSGLRVASIKIPGEEATEARVNFNWTVDDAGQIEFKEDQIGTLASLLGSQELRADNVITGLTGLGSFISNQQRRLYGHVVKRLRSIEKNLKSGPTSTLLGRNEHQRVGAVLLKGDKEQTVFSEVQLLQGVEVPELGLIRLNPREIEAYRGLRNTFDDLYRALNTVQRDDLVSAGYSAIRVNHTSKDGVVRPITVFGKARSEDILSSVPTSRGTPITHTLDARTGNVVDLRTIPNLASEVSAGRVGFVRLKEPFINGDGAQFLYARVDINRIGDLRQAKHVTEIPAYVLDFRRGYVPKVVSDRIGFVVETVGDVVRDGVKVRDVAAYRGFKTRAEADIWVQRKLAKADQTGAEYRIQALDDSSYRRTNPEGAEFVNKSLFLGAFGGNRTDGVFKIGLEGYEGGRMSAFEAIRRYADYVGRHAPMHQFKQGMIKRFMSSIKNPDGSRALDVPHDWTSALTLSKSDPRYRSAKAVQDWMKSVFAIPVTEERHFANLTQTLGYALDRAIWNKTTGTKRFGAGMAEWAQEKLLNSPWAKDPIQQFKSLTFDMMLGMFNPAQVIVQSAGMIVPFSLHPVEATLAMPKFLALRNLFRMTDVNNAALVAGQMGLKPKEFKQMLQGFHRSGFPDSILENADFGHYVGTSRGYYSPGFAQRIREMGRFFYNMGELNTRTFAWSLAHERLHVANAWSRTKELTSDQLLQINNEALRLSMNMMSANRAQWQQGLLALPTQFMQVTAKYYENMLSGLFNVNKGGKWSRSEAASSVFISTLLFGAANWSIDELADDFESWLVSPEEYGIGLDPQKDADTIAAARGGLVEYLAMEALGFGLDISDRISLGSGINMAYTNIIEPMSEAIFTGDLRGLAPALIGASGAVSKRIYTAAGSLWTMFNADLLTGEFSGETIDAAAMDLARITSTGSNALKAWTWQSLNEIINDRTGEPLGMAHPSENPGVIYAQALGFAPLDLEKYYIIDKKSREYQELLIEVSGAAAREYRLMHSNGGHLDPAQRDRHHRNMAVILQRVTEGDRAKILKSMQRIWKEDYKIENLQKQIFEELMQADGAGSRQSADIAILENITRSNSGAE